VLNSVKAICVRENKPRPAKAKGKTTKAGTE